MTFEQRELLRRVLAETANGGRVRTGTRMEIERLLGDGPRCRHCGSTNLEFDGTCRDC